VDDDNPFSPGYGEPPPYLAGRDEVINTAIVALRRGPGRAGYHQMLIGPRGSGKTSTLNAIADLAVNEHGAVVVRWTAGSRPLGDAGAVGAELAERQLRSRWRRAGTNLDASATVGVPGVASATARSRRRTPADPSTFALLERLATQAERRRRTVIIWVDEAQAARPDEIAVLATVMQELANGRRLPITVWAAGLPDTRPRWIDAASPLERQHFTALGNLDADATADAFEIPLRDAGRRINPDALDVLVTGSAGFPYAVQLMGAAAWDAAGDHNLIDIGAARRGVADGVAVLREQLYVARWRPMPPAVQNYLRAAAELEDPITGVIVSSAVARRLGAPTSALSTRRADLIDKHQVLRSIGRDQMAFTQPGFGEWVRALATQRGRDELTDAGNDSLAGNILAAWRSHPASGGTPELGPE
jgi:type II secretory pathway predicted ATPase ExeA